MVENLRGSQFLVFLDLYPKKIEVHIKECDSLSKFSLLFLKNTSCDFSMVIPQNLNLSVFRGLDSSLFLFCDYIFEIDDIQRSLCHRHR